jgi:hypothetical protein
MNKWQPHLLGLVAPAMTLSGLLIGSWWMGLTIFTVLVVYPLIELVVGKSVKTNPLQEGRAHNIILPPSWALRSDSCPHPSLASFD